MNGRIKLSAQEIYAKDFKVDTKGYRIKEIDTFLDEIIEDYQEYDKMVKELTEEKSHLETELINLRSENRKLKMKLSLEQSKEEMPREFGNLDIMKRLSQLERIVYENMQK